MMTMKHASTALPYALAAAVLAVATFAAGLAARPQTGQGADGPEQLFAPPPPPAAEDVLMLRFRDGSVRFAAIAEHDPDGLDVIRVDTSGRARVTWEMLDQTQAEELRTEFGYVDIEASEVYVTGERLLLDGGGAVEGVIISREGDNFLIKTSGNVQALPKSRVRSIETRVQLLALDVYSQDELYGLLVSEADVETAEGQVALAEKCEGILDFVHALEHYRAALELDIDADLQARVEGAIARAEIKAAAQEQVAVLRSAELERRRGNYDEAIALVQAFPTQFPGSALLEDARKAEAKLLEAREKAAIDLVRKRWNFWARRLTRQRAAQGGTFDELRTWAVEGLPTDIEARVLADLNDDISATYQLEDVRRLWSQRERRRWNASTYGTSGTWLLGIEGAQKGIEARDDERAAAVSVADAERRATMERIRRYVENQRVASSRGGGAAAGDEQDQFWQRWSVPGRSQWLLSYYAENGGDYELRENPALKSCATCGGEGAITVMATGTVLRGESNALAPCPLCRGVQVVRRIYYR